MFASFLWLTLCLPARADDAIVAVDSKSQPISTPTTPAEPGPFKCRVDPFIAVRAGETTPMRMKISIPEHTKIYKDMVSVTVLDAAGLGIGELVLPAGESMEDPYGGGPRDVFFSELSLAVPLTAPKGKTGRVDLTVEVRWQGCGENVCYMPGVQTFNVPVRVSAAR